MVTSYLDRNKYEHIYVFINIFKLLNEKQFNVMFSCLFKINPRQQECKILRNSQAMAATKNVLQYFCIHNKLLGQQKPSPSN